MRERVRKFMEEPASMFGIYNIPRGIKGERVLFGDPVKLRVASIARLDGAKRSVPTTENQDLGDYRLVHLSPSALHYITYFSTLKKCWRRTEMCDHHKNIIALVHIWHNFIWMLQNYIRANRNYSESFRYLYQSQWESFPSNFVILLNSKFNSKFSPNESDSYPNFLKLNETELSIRMNSKNLLNLEKSELSIRRNSRLHHTRNESEF